MTIYDIWCKYMHVYCNVVYNQSKTSHSNLFATAWLRDCMAYGCFVNKIYIKDIHMLFQLSSCCRCSKWSIGTPTPSWLWKPMDRLQLYIWILPRVVGVFCRVVCGRMGWDGLCCCKCCSHRSGCCCAGWIKAPTNKRQVFTNFPRCFLSHWDPHYLYDYMTRSTPLFARTLLSYHCPRNVG